MNSTGCETVAFAVNAPGCERVAGAVNAMVVRVASAVNAIECDSCQCSERLWVSEQCQCSERHWVCELRAIVCATNANAVNAIGCV
eukprot:2599007-Amphidinium_carterae.1